MGVHHALLMFPLCWWFGGVEEEERQLHHPADLTGDRGARAPRRPVSRRPPSPRPCRRHVERLLAMSSRKMGTPGGVAAGSRRPEGARASSPGSCWIVGARSEALLEDLVPLPDRSPHEVEHEPGPGCRARFSRATRARPPLRLSPQREDLPAPTGLPDLRCYAAAEGDQASMPPAGGRIGRGWGVGLSAAAVSVRPAQPGQGMRAESRARVRQRGGARRRDAGTLHGRLSRRSADGDRDRPMHVPPV